MIIKWLDNAIRDVKYIYLHIAQDNPKAAQEVARKIKQTVMLLSNQPALGRYGRITHTRELIISGLPYIVPYRVTDNKVEVIRVLHAARQWPEKL